MKHCVTAIATLALGGCSAALFDVPPHQGASYETLQLFYRPLATATAKPYVGDATTEISDLRISIAPQPGDWMACVRSAKDGKPIYVAVFFRDRAVYDSRLANLIDRCEDAQFPMMANVQQVRR